MNSSSKLVKNTFIYAVGNLGTKILAYIMVLIYSYYITPEDLGYYDVIITTISMVQPLIIFQINDGIFRFLIESAKNQQESIISNSIKFLCFTVIVSEVVFGIFSGIYGIDHAFWIGLLLITTIFFTLFQDIIRGLERNKKYAFYGILNSFVMLISEIIGLIMLNMGVKALIISKVIAYIVCIIWMFVENPELYSSIKYRFNYVVLKPILKYSIPLVPNTICWWIVNSSDRFIILFFLGRTYNGIYSMANKFPTILTTITSIFYLAWQESAIKEYKTTKRDEFYSNIFKKYYILLFTLCLCAFPATRIVIELFVFDEFKNSWKYTGFLYLGASFSALCSFLGIGYQISKETNRSIMTTIFAAILNIIINIGCIKYIGLYAASFSTFLAYLFLMIIRVKHSRKYFELDIQWKQFIVLFLCGLIYMYLTFIVPNLLLCFYLEVFAIFVLLVMNKSKIIAIIKNN